MNDACHHLFSRACFTGNQDRDIRLRDDGDLVQFGEKHRVLAEKLLHGKLFGKRLGRLTLLANLVSFFVTFGK